MAPNRDLSGNQTQYPDRSQIENNISKKQIVILPESWPQNRDLSRNQNPIPRSISRDQHSSIDQFVEKIESDADRFVTQM